MQRWFSLLDDAGASWLASGYCRDNLLKIDNKMAAFNALPLHYLEFPLLGKAEFDVTWCFDSYSFSLLQNAPVEFKDAQKFAGKLSRGGMVGVEYDTSSAVISAPSFHFQDTHMNVADFESSFINCFRVESYADALKKISARMRKMGYWNWIYAIMPGRPDAPIRLIAKPPEGLDAKSYLEGLESFGFTNFTSEMTAQIEELLAKDFGAYGMPGTHIDVFSDGTLGPTLGLEFNGIRQGNAAFFPALLLAGEWGLADARWEALVRMVQHSTTTCACRLNTLKFRWRDGQPLPAKLYVIVGL